MKLKRGLQIASLIMLLSVGIAVSSVARADRVDDYVQAQMREAHIPGLSLAVIRQGKIVKIKGYGLANVELKVPATPETMYRVASLTKPFTATAIMLLVHDGKIDLDERVRRYYDKLPDAWKEITVRQLLNHTSGIKDYLNDLHSSTQNGATEEEIISALGGLPLNFKPGARFHYSNSGYLLLDLILQKITGTDYEAYLTERVFRPLGMKNTRRNRPQAIIPDRAGGYSYIKGQIYNSDYLEPTLYTNADAGLIANVRDLARWDMALNTDHLLTEAERKQMWTRATLKDGAAAPYGLGWSIEEINGHRVVFHTGRLVGATSVIDRYPDDRLTVIILTNLGTIGGPNYIARHVAGLYVPALMPHDASIPDREPEITEIVKNTLLKIQDGTIASSPFTSEAWARMYPDEIQGFGGVLKGFGDFDSITLLAKEEKDGLRTYTYRVVFGWARLIIQATFNAENKITRTEGKTE